MIAYILLGAALIGLSFVLWRFDKLSSTLAATCMVVTIYLFDIAVVLAQTTVLRDYADIIAFTACFFVFLLCITFLLKER